MKTNDEIIDRHCPRFEGMERYAVGVMLDECRRDAWEAATKAQLENDNQAVMEDGITMYELVPFPEAQ